MQPSPNRNGHPSFAVSFQKTNGRVYETHLKRREGIYPPDGDRHRDHYCDTGAEQVKSFLTELLQIKTKTIQ